MLHPIVALGYALALLMWKSQLVVNRNPIYLSCVYEFDDQGVEGLVADVQWDLVGQALASGSYNLLLGAGVSLDSESGFKGETCPSANGLRDILQPELPGIRANSSLNRLYKGMSDDQKLQLITNRFVGCTPGPTVQAIARFRWRRIFTFNVDDALEAAYEASSLPPQKFKSLNFTNFYSESRDPTTVPIIHLHGFAREPKSGYVFDIKEYMNSVRDNSIWAHVLGEILRTEPFFVMGTSLEESDLSYFISQKADAPLRLDRATSIMVDPFADQVTQTDCDEYKFSLSTDFALNFLNDLDLKFPSRPSVFQAISENLRGISLENADQTLMAEFHSDFEQVANHPLEGVDSGTNFAYGHQISWIDLQHNIDLARTITSELQTQVLRDSSFKPFIVEGVAGTGKTTVLKRVAWNLAQSGKKCFWLRSIGRIRVNAALAILSRVNEGYVFVDNTADHAAELLSLTSQLKGKKIKFIGAERSYRVPHIERIYGPDGFIMKTLDVIGDDLTRPLIAIYKTYGLATAEYNKHNKFPLSAEVIAIACCRILNNYEPLQTIVDRILKDASLAESSCYIFAALCAFCYRQGVEYDIISARFLDYQVEAQVDDSAPLPLKIGTVSGNEFVTPTNEAMSDTVLRRFGSSDPDGMLEAFISVAKAVRPRVNLPAVINGEPSTRIIARLFDYSEVVKFFLDTDSAQKFYDETRKDWSWNSRYWHQIAQFKLDKASQARREDQKLDLTREAIQHARFAKTIEANHPFTFTTIGKVIFGAMTINRSISPMELAEAIDALCQAAAIEKRNKRVTALPHIALFRGLLDVLELGIPLSHDQRSTVRTEMSRAQEDHRRDRDMRNIIAQLNAVL